MEQPYQPEVIATGTPCAHTGAHHGIAGTPGVNGCDECGAVWATGAPLPVRPTFEERLRDGLLDLAAIGEQTLAEYAEPVGALTCEPGVRVHPLSDTAGISAPRRRVVKL